jgi:RNA polymerase sigma factor (TIGR02999 family)
MSDDMTDEVIKLLGSLENGDKRALDQLIPIVYRELKKLAHAAMWRDGDHHTLQTTELVHEAYLRLRDQQFAAFVNRNQFFAIAARMMRRILVDRARARSTDKRGGEHEHLPVSEEITGWTPSQWDRLIWIDDALKTLSEVAPRPSQVVELRFFGGFNERETAEILGVSEKTVVRDWLFARAWLESGLS